jgi:3-hydroxyisobutyrate dehydrogenase-like beta-hydroxyacid dehydrogenase
VSEVAVVGLGAMGSRIARRLLDTGHEVVVWSRDSTKAEALEELGATAAASPADAASGVGVVVTMVADPPALREVTEGPGGVVGGASEGTIVVQMSTVGPEPVRRLAEALPDGAQVLDAPVLGSVDEAEAGTLTIFAAGSDEVVTRMSPLLSELGIVVHVGPLGAGSAAKLVANSTLFGVLGVLGEALVLGGRLGLTRDETFRVLATTPLAAQAERRRPSIETGDYPTRFTLPLALKDADLVLDSADADLRLAAAARSWIADTITSGRGEQDYTAMLARILDQ